jgi:uncharacterized protein (TIGR02466 family)
MITKHEWWSTPVWEIDTGLNYLFNDKLLEELNGTIPKNSRTNLWEYSTPCLNILKDKIFESLDNTVTEYFPDFYPYNPCIMFGWINENSKGVGNPLHDHGGSLLTCTYYVKSPADCGDLLLVDPRGGVNWEWLEDGGIRGIKYKRVKPKEGKLVLFPAYVLHEVEKNMSDDKRISITTNIHNGSVSNISR